jgi:nucleoside 2-deoxyribosyltransferase
MKVYVIGSLRNPQIPLIGNALREAGFDAFEDWFSAGPEADDKWKEYEVLRGRSYREALKGASAVNIFEFDRRHLNESSAAVMVLPAGRSAHLELGYIVGQGKPGFILLDGEPGEEDRWDVMTQFSTVVYSVEELVKRLKEQLGGMYHETTTARLRRWALYGALNARRLWVSRH